MQVSTHQELPSSLCEGLWFACSSLGLPLAGLGQVGNPVRCFHLSGEAFRQDPTVLKSVRFLPNFRKKGEKTAQNFLEEPPTPTPTPILLI